MSGFAHLSLTVYVYFKARLEGLEGHARAAEARLEENGESWYCRVAVITLSGYSYAEGL